MRVGLEFAAEGALVRANGRPVESGRDGTARHHGGCVRRPPTTLHATRLATTLRNPLADNMGKRRPLWFWDTAILARLAWLLLVAVFAVYASRTLLFTASVSKALAHWGWS